MKTSRKMLSEIKIKNITTYELNAKGTFSLFFSTFSLAKILWKYKPNTIFSWMYHANTIAALASLLYIKKHRLIWGVRHSLDNIKNEKISTKIAIYSGRFLRFIPGKIIYCSINSLKQHTKFLYSSENKSIYIPNGYIFSKTCTKKIKKVASIGAAGRFDPAKDYETLFKAMGLVFKKYPELTLNIAGKNMSYNNATLMGYMEENQIKKNQINLLGFQENMKNFYATNDFFVMSSVNEGFPNVLAESGAAGCICFSTDIGDASIILNDPNRIVNSRDYKALSSLIISYLEKDEQELSLISRKNSEYIRNNFSIEKLKKRYLSLT